MKKSKFSVLVSRNTGGVGDLLMLTPTIKGIKNLFPDNLLIVCTTREYGANVLFDLLENNPYVDKIVEAKDLYKYKFIRNYNFNTGQELLLETNPDHYSSNRIDIFCDLASIKIEDKKPIYIVTDEEKKWANEWIEKNLVRKGLIVGIHVQSTANKRTWPIEKVRLLAFTIVNTWKDSSVFLFNIYNEVTQIVEKPFPNIFSISGFSIRKVAALLDKCDAVVAPDSGLLHLAGALDKKTIALFGPSSPKSRIGYYKNAVGVYLDYPCSPCWYSVCKEQLRCMTDISVSMVMERLSEVLGRSKMDWNSGKLLIARDGGLGDLIMLTPSLRTLKRTHPKLDITLVMNKEYISSFSKLKYLSNVISFDNISGHFDHVLDLRKSVESPEVGGFLSTKLYTSLNRIDIFDRLVGVRSLNHKPDIVVSNSGTDRIKKIIDYDRKYTWIGVHACCTSNLRTFPPEYVPIILTLLLKKGRRIVLFGQTEFWYGRFVPISSDKIKIPGVINLVNKTSVEDLASLCSLMDLMIAPDSSVVHISGALDIPCLAVFGNIDPDLRIKYYSSTRTIYPKDELPCIPCYDFENPCLYYKDMRLEDQPVGGECMRKIIPERIVIEAEKFLKEIV